MTPALEFETSQHMLPFQLNQTAQYLRLFSRRHGVQLNVITGRIRVDPRPFYDVLLRGSSRA